jgi:hypothetical protein
MGSDPKKLKDKNRKKMFMSIEIKIWQKNKWINQNNKTFNNF